MINISPKVAIIILNWNGWEDTIECLESVYQITYPNYDVVVVDNGSKDESVQKIRDYCEYGIGVESKFFYYVSTALYRLPLLKVTVKTIGNYSRFRSQ